MRGEFIFFRGFGAIERKLRRSRDFLVLLHQGKRTFVFISDNNLVFRLSVPNDTVTMHKPAPVIIRYRIYKIMYLATRTLSAGNQWHRNLIKANRKPGYISKDCQFTLNLLISMRLNATSIPMNWSPEWTWMPKRPASCVLSEHCPTSRPFRVRVS